MDNKGYQRLASAIVLKAIADFTSAKKALAKDEDDIMAQSTIIEIKNFFRSDFYQAICEIDGEYMIDELEKGRLRYVENRGRNCSCDTACPD